MRKTSTYTTSAPCNIILIDVPNHQSHSHSNKLWLSVFNGIKRVNVSRGTQKPQFCPLIAAHFSLQDKVTHRYISDENFLETCFQGNTLYVCKSYIFFIMYRYSSQSLLLPFQEPSLQTHTREERSAFQKLLDLMEVLPSSAGCVIGMGKKFEQDHEEQILHTIRN